MLCYRDHELNKEIQLERILSHMSEDPFDITCETKDGITTFLLVGKTALIYKSPYKCTFKCKLLQNVSSSVPPPS